MIDRAAIQLRMSYVQLDEHPRKFEYLVIARTLEQGISDGEYLRELNPKYQKQIKEVQAQLKRARG